MKYPNRLETVDDLLLLTSAFCPGAYPETAASFIEFGTKTRTFARGTFGFENPERPVVLFRECQSLVICTADSDDDSADLYWDLHSGQFRYPPRNIKDFVIGLVFDDMQFYDAHGWDGNEEDHMPEGLPELWRGRYLSDSGAESFCGILDDTLWVSLAEQCTLSLRASHL
jgi:hypothetical protein